MNEEKTKLRFYTNCLANDNGCWLWQKGKDKTGYGKVNTRGEHMAHRLSYVLHIGVIPENHSVRHRCENLSCVNPSHLFIQIRGSHNRLNEDEVIKKLYRNITKKDNGCWEWRAFKSPEGYGKFKVLGESLAHRVSFRVHKGLSLTEEECVLHKCDNPPCINPDHLFKGSKADNNKDRAQKGRTVIFNSLKTHCKRGHVFDEKNTFIRKNGSRLCRMCEHLRHKGLL